MANGHSPLDRGFDWYVGLPYSDDMGCGAAPTLTMAPLNAEHTMACPACRKNNEPAVKCPADPSCGRPNGCFGEDMGVPLFHNRTIVAQPVDLGKVSQNYTVRPPNLRRLCARYPCKRCWLSTGPGSRVPRQRRGSTGAVLPLLRRLARARPSESRAGVGRKDSRHAAGTPHRRRQGVCGGAHGDGESCRDGSSRRVFVS